MFLLVLKCDNIRHQEYLGYGLLVGLVSIKQSPVNLIYIYIISLILGLKYSFNKYCEYLIFIITSLYYSKTHPCYHMVISGFIVPLLADVRLSSISWCHGSLSPLYTLVKRSWVSMIEVLLII